MTGRNPARLPKPGLMLTLLLLALAAAACAPLIPAQAPGWQPPPTVPVLGRATATPTATPRPTNTPAGTRTPTPTPTRAGIHPTGAAAAPNNGRATPAATIDPASLPLGAPGLATLAAGATEPDMTATPAAPAPAARLAGAIQSNVVRRVTVLYTNDEHGWIAPQKARSGGDFGGFAELLGRWGRVEGYVLATRVRGTRSWS